MNNTTDTENLRIKHCNKNTQMHQTHEQTEKYKTTSSRTRCSLSNG